jgi:hypothetical protein
MNAEEFDLDLEDSPVGGEAKTVRPPRKGLFAIFAVAEGRTLELHVPQAMGIVIGGPSEATEPSFILREPDGSIEHSGGLVME